MAFHFILMKNIYIVLKCPPLSSYLIPLCPHCLLHFPLLSPFQLHWYLCQYLKNPLGSIYLRDFVLADPSTWHSLPPDIACLTLTPPQVLFRCLLIIEVNHDPYCIIL